MRLILSVVTLLGSGILVGNARAEAPRTGLYLFDGGASPAGWQTFDKALQETLQGDSRIRFTPLVAAKPDPKVVEAELAQADRDMSTVEAAFSEMNLGKARTVTDQVIAVYEKHIVELAARPNGTQPLRNAWIKAARVRFFDGDEAGAKQAVQRALALDGKLAFSTELFPLPMKAMVTEAKKAFDHAGAGKVTIESQPLGASVYINGKPLPHPTPTEALGIGAGPNYIRFEKPGYTPFVSTVNVTGATSGSYSSTTLAPAGGRLPGLLASNVGKLDTATQVGGIKEAMHELGLDLVEIVRLERIERTDGPPIRVAGYTYSVQLDRIVKKVDRRVNEGELDQQGRLLARDLLSGGVLEGKVAEEPVAPTNPEKGKKGKVKGPVVVAPTGNEKQDDGKIAGLSKPIFWTIIGVTAGVVLIGVGVGVGVGLTVRNGWWQQQQGILRAGITF